MLKSFMPFLSNTIAPETATLRAKIKSLVEGASKKLGYPAIEVEITYPKYENFGDYSTNYALSIVKHIKQNPREVAKNLAEVISQDLPEFIDRVEVAGPGFLNFYLNYKNAIEYGYSFPKIALNTKDKIVVEHTSVNPNKALHVGHIRNAVLGDTIARLLHVFFKKIEVQNYIDDTGLQVADTTAALHRYGENIPRGVLFDDYCWDIYARFHRELKDPEKSQELSKLREKILHQIEAHSGEFFKLSQKVVKQILDHHLAELSSLNIAYDLLVYEKDIIAFKLWESAFEILKASGKLRYHSDGKYRGCWVFESKAMPPKILVRSNGTKVYTAKDIAYHLWKIGALDVDFLYKPWDGTLYQNPQLYQTSKDGKAYPDRFGRASKVINVIDYRQSYPQQVVREAVEEIVGKKDLIYHLAYGVVSLSKDTAAMLGVDVSDGKNSYAMSGRKGIGVKSKDLYKKVKQTIVEKVKQSGADVSQIDVDAITVAAIRYEMVKYTAQRDMVFDINQATQFVGKSGPYLQYSYVRGLNILRKFTSTQNPSISWKDYASGSDFLQVDFSALEKALVATMARHSEALYDAVSELEPVIYAEYAFYLASVFNSFYEKHRILSEKDEKVRRIRLGLVAMFLEHMGRVLDLLGIPRVERM